MRKADYAILADTIQKHRTSASPVYVPCDTTRALVLAHSEAIARTFARFASVDKAQFLRACGIE